MLTNKGRYGIISPLPRVNSSEQGKNGGIAQLARATGSYPVGHRFKSGLRYHIGQGSAVPYPSGTALVRGFPQGPLVKRPKTPPFHGGNTSSILVRVTKYICRCGGIGRHKGLKIPRSLRPYRFKSGHRHQKTATRAVFFVSVIF